jgi:enoyl-CoA hydratase
MTIHYEERGHIALIVIDRPERRGAMDAASYAQLAAAWKAVLRSAQIRVAVITGVQDSYCAGADLQDFIPEVARAARAKASGNLSSRDIEGGFTPVWADNPDTLPDGQWAVLKGIDFPKPIIAAVNGPCVASGMEMLLATDIRLASPNAVFGLPEVKRGLFAAGGSTARLARQIPYAHAMDILLTGRYLDADEAVKVGLINRVVDRERLVEEALAVAELIAANSPTAVTATKQSVLRGIDTGVDGAYKIESDFGDYVFASGDAVEGPRAFLEKRPPRWTETSIEELLAVTPRPSVPPGS